MLKTENTNMNMSGSISHDDVAVASVSGSFNGGEDIYMHINIPNYNDAIENKAVLFADLEAFINQMFDAVVELKN